MYPVNGTNGDEYSSVAPYKVLPKTPVITGNCASSPSKKNPVTLSPGDNDIVDALLPLPDPAVTGNNTCAQGRSLSFNSTVLLG